MQRKRHPFPDESQLVGKIAIDLFPLVGTKVRYSFTWFVDCLEFDFQHQIFASITLQNQIS